MGRPERPIDPDAGPVAELASDLRKLRDKAGRPSYRELARRASFSVTVLSEAAGGRALPTLAVVKGYVRACGGDACEWEERWRRAAGQWREAAEGAARPAPYRGLAGYGVRPRRAARRPAGRSGLPARRAREGAGRSKTGGAPVAW
jgi:hypothetical protein